MGKNYAIMKGSNLQKCFSKFTPKSFVGLVLGVHLIKPFECKFTHSLCKLDLFTAQANFVGINKMVYLTKSLSKYLAKNLYELTPGVDLL